MFDFLFNLIIYPITLILECVFSVLYTSIFKGNVGIALAGLSLAVNLLCLPMYTKAEQLQQLERDIQKKLAKKAASIKKHFTGDERYFILSNYYRENNYHPLYSLRSSLSLLIQIPFFIAAYNFLVNLDILNGKSFFFINDLSLPDSLFAFSSFSINILPIAMTAINLITGIIYSNDLSTKDKIQLYITPFIFLLLLYNSPSALVLYWTINNIFSLFKTLLLKIKNPQKIIYIISCSLAFLFVLYIFFIRHNAPDRAFRNKLIAAAILAFFILLPLILKGIRFIIRKANIESIVNNYPLRLFIISLAAFWLLAGFFIPSNIISSDPVQFAVNNIQNPLMFIYFPLIQGAGLFLFWPLILYFLSAKENRNIISLTAAAATLYFFTNYFIFQPNYGIISQTLQFSLISGQYLSKSIAFSLINIFCFIIILASIIFLFKLKKIRFVFSFLIILSLGTFAYSFVKITEIKKNTITSLPETLLPSPIQLQHGTEIQDSDKIWISTTGKNVFIIMLDTAISSYFPLFLNERPELRDSFRGFTYYPNTASFYRRTMFGVPPLFGGYEYSSYNMQRRNTATIKEQQQESLTILPLLFKNAGFYSAVADMPNVEFFDTPAKEYYESYGIQTKDMEGKYNKKYMQEVLSINELISNAKIDKLIKRNMLMLSIVKTFPYFIRDFLYNNGNYLGIADYNLDSVMSDTTVGSYTALYYLPELTKTGEEENTFYIITNNLAHDRAFFQYPDYTLEAEITNHGDNFFNSKKSFMKYHINAASYMLLTKWFNKLQEYSVWDNTRIIIVSDHGDLSMEHPDFNAFQNNYVIPYNPILLVKDFNSNESLSTNNDFMTNADIPLLALKDIIHNPINPFTGNPLVSDKDNGIYIYTQGYTNAKWYQGIGFLESNSLFFHVHSNIFDQKNWKELKYRDFKDTK
ncbi:MAG: membrane protein insertase YidC [Treponema sp.]|jgi:YidC/Oxa1 family membrane protein insertase|nr:membrane protein insertase YidC [Treponema sp.]